MIGNGNCGIYSIRCLVNGKRYVGQSQEMRARLLSHIWNLEHGRHFNSHLQAAFIKYGADNFESCVLEEVPAEMLDERERVWITYYKSNQPQFGYNLQSGGSLLHNHSVETRLKMSKSKQGTRPSAECMRRSLETIKGKPIPLERRLKIASTLTGKTVSLTTRKKMRETHKKLWKEFGRKQSSGKIT